MKFGAMSLAAIGTIGAILPGRILDTGWADGGERRKAKAMAASPQLLAVTTYSEGRSQRLLLFWKAEIRHDIADRVAFLKKHPEQNSFPREVLTLVDTPGDSPDKGRVVWVCYFSPKPQEKLSAGVVWHAGRQEAWVVLAKSVTWHVSLEGFPVDTRKSIAAHPLHLDAKKFAEWPKDQKPYAQLKMTLDEENVVFGIKAVALVPGRDHLLIHVERDTKEAQPVYFRLGLETKEWSRVKLEDIKIQPRKQ